MIINHLTNSTYFLAGIVFTLLVATAVLVIAVERMERKAAKLEEEERRKAKELKRITEKWKKELSIKEDDKK